MALDYRSLSRGELIRLLKLRDRRHKALAQAGERYRKLVVQAADGIFVADERGILLEVNESGARMLGLAPREIVGRHIRSIVTPADIPALEADLAALRRKRGYRSERRIRRQDGSSLPVEVNVKKLPDGRIQGILRDITMRKQGEEALRQSEERFSKLTAAAFEGICITASGRILDVNNPFTDLFGYGRAELVGRKILTLIAPKWRPLIAARIRTGQGTLVEHQLLRKDGSVFDAEAQSKVFTWRGQKVRVTAVRDITERKRAERALRESEEKFSKAFRASPDGLAISELATGRYIEVNDGYCRLYGYRRAEMLGRTSIDLGIWDNPKDRARLVAGLKTAGKVRDLEVRTRTRKGELRIILLSAEPIELGGKSCLLSALHDITDRKRAEAARAEAVQREQQARAEYTRQLIGAQEAERARIAAELHDSLGQNLLLIKNHAQLALGSPALPPNRGEQLEKISRLASQSIAETRQISHDLHPHQLDHLGLTRALEVMIESAASSSATVFHRKLDNVDGVFPKDAALNLYRIVQESLNNILKHSGAKQARLRLERDVHDVQLHIRDNGSGFLMRESVNSGKGLGLKNIAERVRLLGGKLKLDAQPGRGTRLAVTIPIAGGGLKPRATRQPPL